METLTTALFLAVVVKAILDYFAEPLRNKFPDLDLWWFNYVAVVMGAIVSWFTEINLFADFIPNTILGRILTALLIGGGSKLLNDVFSNAPGRALPAARGLEPTEEVVEPRARGW